MSAEVTAHSKNIQNETTQRAGYRPADSAQTGKSYTTDALPKMPEGRTAFVDYDQRLTKQLSLIGSDGASAEPVGRDVQPNAFSRDSNLLATLMIGLAYPSILGSILYSVFGNLHTFVFDKASICCMLLMCSVICVFTIDYLFATIHNHYGVIETFADVLLLALLHIAFSAVNFFTGSINAGLYAVCMGLTFAIFVVWDLMKYDQIGEKARIIISFEAVTSLAFFIAGTMDFGLVCTAAISIIAASTLVALFTDFRSDLRSCRRTLLTVTVK